MIGEMNAVKETNLNIGCCVHELILVHKPLKEEDYQKPNMAKEWLMRKGPRKGVKLDQ